MRLFFQFLVEGGFDTFNYNITDKTRVDLPPQLRRFQSIRDAKKQLEENEFKNLFTPEDLTKMAIRTAEQDGIVFIDEIDKICDRKDSFHYGAEASTEGVQKDLLPIIEGSVVNTEHGNVNTSHMLFIASGAFHSCKPSDLISELQGRLPIRVELKALSQDDLYKVLTQTEMSLIKQQVELLKTEKVSIKFNDDAIHAIARIATEVNAQVENIGARRLHTIIERVVENISFNCDTYAGQVVEFDDKMVTKSIEELLVKTDLSKFIL